MFEREFSLVIPTYNRGESLLEVLRYLECLEYARERFEVIVVDDGSTDGSFSAAAELEVNYHLRLLQQSNAGAGAARNHGIREATGGFCLFIDDDVFPAPHLLYDHHQCHQGEMRLLVRGPVINIPSLPLPPEPDNLWKHFSMNYLCTSNASLRTELLLEAGLFDEKFDRWEDAELGVRLKRIGVKRRFTNRGYVFHLKPPLTPEQTLTIAARDGRSAAQLYRRYPTFAMRLRSGLHPLNFLRNELFTAAPLRGLYKRWLERPPSPAAANFARNLLAEREYLSAGRRELRKD